MTEIKKATVGAAANHNSRLNYIHIRLTISNRTKSFVICAACWGIVPIFLADWLIKHLHLENKQ